MGDFENKIANWRSLQWEARREYYYKELFDTVVGQARERWKASSHSKDEYDILISLSGFSPETTIIAFRLINPKSLFVISSEKTNKSIDVISEYIIGNGQGRIPSSKFIHESCDPTSPLEIYNLIRNKINRIYKDKSQSAKLRGIIDITGGKKVMSAAAALVAWQLDMPICYIENSYDPSLRQPIPGSEELIFLDNPITLYGEEEMNKVLVLFQSGHYGEALNRYKELAERISEPTYARFMRDLSLLYSAWCNVEMTSLSDAINKVKCWLVDPRIKPRFKADEFICLSKQIEFLQRLSQKDISARLLCFYLLGRHYQDLGRYDFAGLFFYRTIEGCLRERLESQYPPFNTKYPDYRLLGISIEELKRRYREIARSAFNNSNEYALPNWALGYISSAIILLVLRDPLLKDAGFPTASSIGQIRHLGEIRNSSILAHGFNSISEAEAKSIMKVAERLLNAYWRLTVKDDTFGKDIMEIYQNIKFIRFDNLNQ